MQSTTLQAQAQQTEWTLVAPVCFQALRCCQQWLEKTIFKQRCMLEAEISLLIERGAFFCFPLEVDRWKYIWQLVFLRGCKTHFYAATSYKGSLSERKNEEKPSCQGILDMRV